MDEKDIQAINERIKGKLESTKFAYHITDEAWEYVWMNGLRLKVAKMLNLKNNDKVLDVGCGDGWFSVQNALKHPNVKFIGIDLFEAEEAKNSKLIGIKNCKFYKVDALNMRIKEKVDHVVFYMALGNICEDAFDLKKLFRNCWNIMKNGAKLLVVEAFEEDFPREIRRKLKDLYEIYEEKGKSYGENKERILARKATLIILKSIGFKVLKITWKKFKWFMNEEEVKEYFGFKELPFKIPKKFWVFDKPKKVTIIIAIKEFTKLKIRVEQLEKKVA